MLEIIGLCKSYPGRSGPRPVFRDFSLSVPDGLSIGLIGPNGAGKSTLMRLLGGLERPDRGRILTDERISWPIGLAGGLQGSLTGRDNVRFVCRIHGVRDTQPVEEWVKEFSEIGQHFELPIKTYSGGMKSKFSFAVSMAFDFDIYLTDEITSVGDARFKQKCIDTFNQKRETASLIMVSHDMKNLRQQCDMGILLRNGTLEIFDDIDDAIRIYQNL